MRDGPLRYTRHALLVVALVLALAACGTDDAEPVVATTSPLPSAASAPGPGPSPTPTPAPSPTPTPSPAEEAAWEDLPPELAAVLPETEAEMDELVLDAEEAYRAHRAAYDAAAATGFTDQVLLEELLAGAGWRTLEALRTESRAVIQAGYVIDGGIDVVGMEVLGISPPEEGWPGVGIVLGVCLDVHGTIRGRDGAALREIVGEPGYVQARLMEHEGGWLVMEQSQQEGPCPEHLNP